MLKNNTVGIWNKGPSTKVNGITIPGVLGWVKDIDVDIQPYSKALLLKNYGYDIEVDKRVYVDYFDSNINIGTILKYTDKYGKEINLSVKVIPWDDEYMEIICLGVS
ncbi:MULTISPECIES: hypothetical protein [Clostridium]|uniref:Uncharacterized protein n=1 Tax=Clostridium frigoriphilum TaxID=443253 RepID=A0ABU7UKN7_9CLOT|nr:hypothetical protein [Clostridium sp. DSM 17811]MBU3098382.1 hypothetical protein [Clostridium sp. DSM 17811]